jgi:hypothetical protein
MDMWMVGVVNGAVGGLIGLVVVLVNRRARLDLYEWAKGHGYTVETAKPRRGWRSFDVTLVDKVGRSRRAVAKVGWSGSVAGDRVRLD